MAERAPFLSAVYSAYYHRQRPEDERELTRVGPGTPCGEYLRRYWQPVILAEELGELPRRLRRQADGALGQSAAHEIQHVEAKR